ncbi:uncharacterized protein LOC113238634 [Hyposmocoma kahamanoa]|uniref:uncharacterized protein LOC113238634 n=1 Tax=Hyposmocoma kahamanoa TaxID=1477025 RepID=UPI000E6D9576|nr:uncharacterized protein LOC113238634 [Hyposmocoma kahamanoa]
MSFPEDGQTLNFFVNHPDTEDTLNALVDIPYQRILWRQSPKEKIEEYELTTVTYGTASAPYLATRTLQQLAIDEKDNFPKASQVTLHDFYVDDILSGAHDVNSAKQLQTDLINMLRTGGFNLRKWSSNNGELLDNIPDRSDIDDKTMKLPLEESRKSLGVLWSPIEDIFCYKVTTNNNKNPTKRFILSEIAKLFDPLGWLAPVIVTMKIITQELFTNSTEWDQPVDEKIKHKWTEIQQQLKTIESIKIPRWCYVTPSKKVELHGVCDASEKAYGAVIYCRVQDSDKTYRVTLLQAKSKVALNKQRTTLPRLELCAVLLLAQLMEKVIKTMNFIEAEVYCWTDSMITLGWIKGEANRWKTFVANRVSEIQKQLPQAKWNHVITSQNPADIISRGTEPKKLLELPIWWNGPSWLNDEYIPTTKTVPEICEEIKRSHQTTISTKENQIWDRFSSYQKMIRVLSYCYRLLYKERGNKSLSCEEIERTRKQVLLLVKQEEFQEEYNTLKQGKPLKKGSKLTTLDPFIDMDGLLRVGGRLQNSNLPYNQKHPIRPPICPIDKIKIFRDRHQYPPSILFIEAFKKSITSVSAHHTVSVIKQLRRNNTII